MTADPQAARNGRAAVAFQRGARSELDVIRATCRRQAGVIDTLGGAISAFRAGATALKAENAELRADNERMRERHEGRFRRSGASDDASLTEVSFLPDLQAPTAARAIVTRELRDRVAAMVLERAQLLASELTTNSVRHGAATGDTELVFRVEVSNQMVRLEIQDPGHDGAIAPRPPGGGGGFGLNIVQTLSERWGFERVATGGTRVWAQIALESLTTPLSTA